MKLKNNRRLTELLENLSVMGQDDVTVYNFTREGREKIKRGIPFGELERGGDYQIKIVPADYYL